MYGKKGVSFFIFCFWSFCVWAVKVIAQFLITDRQHGICCVTLVWYSLPLLRIVWVNLHLWFKLEYWASRWYRLFIKYVCTIAWLPWNLSLLGNTECYFLENFPPLKGSFHSLSHSSAEYTKKLPKITSNGLLALQNSMQFRVWMLMQLNTTCSSVV